MQSRRLFRCLPWLCGVLLWPESQGLTQPIPSFPGLPSATPLSYRQKLTGMLPGDGKELQWTLSTHGKGVRLVVRRRVCKSASPLGDGVSVPCRMPFSPPLVVYDGKVDRRPYGVDIWVSSEKPVDGFPSEMSLNCLRTTLGVLPAGAVLVPGDSCKGDGPPPRWQPATPRDVGAWFCTARSEYGGPWIGFEAAGPLVFAAGAGLEWVYVNNDCAGQEGAFRFPLPDK